MQNDNISRSVNILSRQLKRGLDIQVAKYGITGVQCGMIQYIYKKSKEKNVFARDIEKKFDIRRASMAGILQNMEKNDLIKREDIDSDGRLKRIVLTNKALKLRKIIEQEIENLENKAMKNIKKEDLKKFLEIAEKMSLNLEEK